MKSLSKRNHLMDAMKTIAALGVIFVHFPFPGVIGKICAAFGTVGVIFFFLISGYQSYCDNPSESGKLLKRFKRNLNLVIAVLLVYVIYKVIEQIAMGGFSSWAQTYLLDPITYIRMLVLGDFSFISCDPLWYLVAMLYGYLIIYLMEKYRLHKIFYIALPLLLLLRASMETYTNSFSHFSWFDWHFSGNFLVGALPMMLLGNYIRRNEEKILEWGKKLFTPLAILSMALVFITVNVKILEMDISQPFKMAAATFFFMICLVLPLEKPVRVLGNIGRSLSLHIYVWHFLIGNLIKHLLTYLNADLWVFDWFLPIATIVASILLSLLLFKLESRKNTKNA